MDLVYILKPGDLNTDLRYSLRSVFANVQSFDRIWVSGFKPCWVGAEVGYIEPIPVAFGRDTKWKSALANVLAACINPDVSKTFALMNDDFFAIHPTALETDLNFCRGPLDMNIAKYRNDLTSHWKKSFHQTKKLLKKLGIIHFDDFTLHMPMLINKDNFLYMARQDAVKQHLREHAMLSFRSVYGNMFYTYPEAVEDCKISRYCDLSKKLAARQWISVFDNVTCNLELYPRLGSVLGGIVKCGVEAD
ncbi:MAG: hypothetical protein IKO41_21495 [Lachnospiraceae bacterium]|nr:hypothetical protein [Lachnospiraceae bacterium]